MPDNNISYFSRFTVKFVEIVAAGIATAVSGYLVAHLGGYWSSPASPQAAIVAAPGVTTVPKSSRAQPAHPLYTGAIERRPATTPDATAGREASPPVARTTANATQAASARKHVTAETGGVEAKPHEAESKPREVESRREAESKSRDAESVAAQVRAALANVDASRPAPAGQAPPQSADIPPALHPAETSSQPLPLAPLEPPPLGTVEIKSQPVAAVDASPAPVAPPQESVQEDRGMFAAIKKIPDMLRPASGAIAEPPRPPRPVGD